MSWVWVPMGRNQEDGQQGRYPGGSLFKTTQPGWRGRQSILQTTGRCLMIFKLLDLCWKLSTVERRHVEGNFLTQIMCVSQQGKTSLDLLFVNREGLGVMWWSETVLGMVRALTKWELSILSEGREGINWPTRGQTLACSGQWFRESLAKQSVITMGSRKAGQTLRRKS